MLVDSFEPILSVTTMSGPPLRTRYAGPTLTQLSRRLMRFETHDVSCSPSLRLIEHWWLAFLSALYVAVSRARAQVSIVVNDDESDAPTILKQAITAAYSHPGERAKVAMVDVEGSAIA